MPVSIGAGAVKALAYKLSRLHCGYTVGHKSHLACVAEISLPQGALQLKADVALAC